jgi:hypothetical protein
VVITFADISLLRRKVRIESYFEPFPVFGFLDEINEISRKSTVRDLEFSRDKILSLSHLNDLPHAASVGCSPATVAHYKYLLTCRCIYGIVSVRVDSRLIFENRPKETKSLFAGQWDTGTVGQALALIVFMVARSWLAADFGMLLAIQ